MLTSFSMIVGLDFDNTIIDYGPLFRTLAIDYGLVGPNILADKISVRNAVRRLRGGEIKWQHLQAQVYGPRISDACPTPRFKQFIARCLAHGAEVIIVSHKNRFAAQDHNKAHDLIKAATRWLQSKQITGQNGLLDDRSLHFEITREQKIERIVQLKCDVFVDDLVETFGEPNFPNNTKKILFDPFGHRCDRSGVVALQTWDAIGSAIFPGQHIT